MAFGSAPKLMVMELPPVTETGMAAAMRVLPETAEEPDEENVVFAATTAATATDVDPAAMNEGLTEATTVWTAEVAPATDADTGTVAEADVATAVDPSNARPAPAR